MLKNKKLGFTLMELLVVVAIVGILAVVVLVTVDRAKNNGIEAGIKSNLVTVRNVAEMFYLDNDNSYLPAAGAEYSLASCPEYDPAGTNMFSQNKDIAAAIKEAGKFSIATACYNSADKWAVSIGYVFKGDNLAICTDSANILKKYENTTAEEAIDQFDFRCSAN